MRFKTFTQSYFLIKSNSSYQTSLIKRAAAVTNGVVIAGLALYSWWPDRIYATEHVNWCHPLTRYHHSSLIIW